MTGGAISKGSQRIQYDFRLNGVRYRPTLKAIATEANLRRAREHLKAIKEHIRLGTFSFIEEFPDFRDLHKVFHHSPYRTCHQVFDEYLSYCDSRLSKHDLSFATVRGYRKALDSIWRPKLGPLPFLQVRYSTLLKIASQYKTWSKKTYNNKISVLRRACEFGYRDHPDHATPAWALKGARIRRRDLPRIDPFRIQDAEALITAIHQDWGEVQGNFHELRFFTGLRPSEEIALKERDFDEVRGTLSVTKARVYGVDKDTTKTHEDRVIQLCPRAIAALTRQLALHRHLKSRGRIDHDQLFFQHDGAPVRDLGYLAKCWRKSSERLGLRFRRPYCARHTSVSWNLMIGKNPLFVSRQHGHSVTTMWRTYAAWMEGALESDIALIQAAMNRDGRAIEQVSNTQIELTLKAPAVAGLGTRLATRREAPEAQVPDKKGQKQWRRGWDCSRPGTAARPPLRSGPLQPGCNVQNRAAILSNRWVRPHTLLH
jgi:integrase